jgi:hypothetical protein
MQPKDNVCYLCKTFYKYKEKVVINLDPTKTFHYTCFLEFLEIYQLSKEEKKEEKSDIE